MSKDWIIKKSAIIVGIVAFTYFALLAERSYSWQFAGGDSGDWLASALQWMNSQPYGSPLYVLLGHLMNAIAPSHLVIAMVFGLSVIPASITVVAVYLIVKKLTDYKLAIVSALVLLGSAVFLSQATILEEYAIASMFVTLAYYFYIQDKKKLTVLMLALGSAVHVIVMLISAIWLLVNLKDFKKWLPTFPIYIIAGLVPYSLVLILMYVDVPRFLAPHLSLAGLNNYLGSSGTIGAMSLWEAPKRLLQFIMVIVVSLGFAIVPIIFSLKGIFKQNRVILIALCTILLTLWLYLTDSDPSTWTFMNFGWPLIMVLLALGLQKMQSVHRNIVIASAVTLILLNGIFLNANILTIANPLATQYEQSVKSLPDGSYLVCNSGGNYGLANYYVMAQGKKITPIFYSADVPDLQGMIDLVKTQNKGIKDTDALKLATEKYKDSISSARQIDYMKWAGLTENETTKEVALLLGQGKSVYVVTPTLTSYWQNVFQTEYIDDNIAKVIGFENTQNSVTVEKP